MYSRYRLAQKYFHYYVTAANGKGHGIHSPFVFDFVIHVLNDNRRYAAYTSIERLRRRLKFDKTLLEIEDLGAGSAWSSPLKRSVGDITRRAAKPAKLGQLLYRIARYCGAQRVVELGTSLGFSTAYLAAGVRDWPAEYGGFTDWDSDEVAAGKVWSIEGAPQVSAAAARNLSALGLQAELVTGNFDDVLPRVLGEMGKVDLGFVDGNHRREPTLAYFELLMGAAARPSVLIFDDIHWSVEMEEAWEAIKNDPRVYLTIDLFFIGLVFLHDAFLVKQHFTIRF